MYRMRRPAAGASTLRRVSYREDQIFSFGPDIAPVAEVAPCGAERDRETAHPTAPMHPSPPFPCRHPGNSPAECAPTPFHGHPSPGRGIRKAQTR